jgi:hypothetical protein
MAVHVFNEFQRALARVFELGDEEKLLLYTFLPDVLNQLNRACGTHVLCISGIEQTYTPDCIAYDIANEKWHPVDAMYPMANMVKAEPLPDGTVLCTEEGRIRAYVYDPVRSEFVLTANRNTAYFGHSTAKMPDGRIVSVGGYDHSQASIEYYYPAERVWRTTSASFRGVYAAVVAKRDGTVVIIGGNLDPRRYWSFHADTGNITRDSFLVFGRKNHAAVLLPNGDILTSGGDGDDGHVEASCEILLSYSRVWRPGPPLARARSHHRMVLLPTLNAVLVMGGEDDNQVAMASCEMLQLSGPQARWAWRPAADMPLRRQDFGAVLVDAPRLKPI